MVIKLTQNLHSFKNSLGMVDIQWLYKYLLLSGNEQMICIKTEIPEEICNIDDELKAIYHSKDTICIWVFKTREDRNKFMDDTVGMKKDDRQNYYDNFYK